MRVLFSYFYFCSSFNSSSLLATSCAVSVMLLQSSYSSFCITQNACAWEGRSERCRGNKVWPDIQPTFIKFSSLGKESIPKATALFKLILELIASDIRVLLEGGSCYFIHFIFCVKAVGTHESGLFNITQQINSKTEQLPGVLVWHSSLQTALSLTV